MSVKNWNNGKSEIFRHIAVVCPECESEVEVTGYLEEGEMTLDNCPTCGHELALEVTNVPNEPVTEGVSVPSPHLTKAIVNWYHDGVMKPQSTAVIGPTTNILTLLVNVLDDGVKYFNPGNPAILHAALAKCVLENYVPPDMRKEIANALLNPPTPSAQDTNNEVLNIHDIIDEDDKTEDDES